jgi:serine/threonine-protein kinase
VDSASCYSIIKPIASGGMGTVYLGKREGLGGFSRVVALKRAHADLALKPAVQRRFTREANAASLLHHANVVAVVDVFSKDGDTWLVLDWVDGVNLAELLTQHGQLPIGVALRIVLDACNGLSAAHELRVDDAPLGLQHRDVSPGNILVGRDGVARLADFGLSRTLDTTLTNTEDRFLEGKLGYLAPELFQGKDFDVRCDLFALGVVAWEAAAGMRLFRAKSLTKLMAEQRAPTKLSAIYPKLAWLEPVIERAIAFDPAARVASVREFANLLQAAALAHGALSSAEDVARFMLGTKLEPSEPSQTPLNPSLRELTPATGPLLESISVEVERDLAASQSRTEADALLTSSVMAPSVANLAPINSPPVLIAEPVVATAAAPSEPAPTVEEAPTPAAVVPLRPAVSEPLSLSTSVSGHFAKPRPTAWIAGLAAALGLSIGLIALTQSAEPGAPSSRAAPSFATNAPTPVKPSATPSVSSTQASSVAAIVIGPDEAESARVRERELRPSADKPVELRVVPSEPVPASNSKLPTNPYRKKN